MKPNKPKNPPGTTAIMGRCRAWFAGEDADKDGMLVKEELSRIFRGARAV